MKDLSNDKELSRRVLVQLVGMKLTDIYYTGSEIVAEFDGLYRLEFLPRGATLLKRNDAQELSDSIC